jgi:prevent-host-death family protein
MRTISSTEASRCFSDLLDRAEAGKSVIVTRGGRPVAEIRPVPRRTGRNLRVALAGLTPPDDHFADDIADAISHLS